VGDATLLYTDIFDYGEGYQEVEGYEWIVGRILMTFSDANARSHGIWNWYGNLDYYSFDPDGKVYDYADLPESGIMGNLGIGGSKLNYYGDDYEYYVKWIMVQNEWIGRTFHLMYEFIYLVPKGYDGIVVYISDSFNYSDGMSIKEAFDQDTLFFRLRD